MKNIQEDIIKHQNEIIEILKAQLKNANDMIEQKDKLINMQEEFINNQSQIFENLLKIKF
jgi:hypothetical protein